MTFYGYRDADHGEYTFYFNGTKDELEKMFREFCKTVRDPGYLDQNKFVPFLRKKGWKACVIHKRGTICSWHNEDDDLIWMGQIRGQ